MELYFVVKDNCSYPSLIVKIFIITYIISLQLVLFVTEANQLLVIMTNLIIKFSTFVETTK